MTLPKLELKFGADQELIIDRIIDKLQDEAYVEYFAKAKDLEDDSYVLYSIQFTNILGIYLFGHRQANMARELFGE